MANMVFSILNVVDRVPAAEILNLNLLVPAVYNRKPMLKHTAKCPRQGLPALPPSIDVCLNDYLLIFLLR